MTKVSILVKIKYSAYQQLDEGLLQTAIVSSRTLSFPTTMLTRANDADCQNALASDFEKRILPHCATVEQLRLCIEFKCDGPHGKARYPCPSITRLCVEDVPRTLTVLRVGLTDKNFTRLLPGNLEVRIIGDHFPEWCVVW